MMEQEQLRLSTETLPGGIGVISASGYINNEGGQAVADAATELVGGGCSSGALPEHSQEFGLAGTRPLEERNFGNSRLG